MSDVLNPNIIEVLLHCYISPRPHPRFDAPAVQEALHLLEVRELIAPTDPPPADPMAPFAYRTTEGGVFLVKALCAVPFPVKKWAMP